MTPFKSRPYLSLIGFCLVIFTILINIAFSSAEDPGLKMVLSTFSAILLVFTLLWSPAGIIEFILLINKTGQVKFSSKNGQISREEYRGRINSLIMCFLVNVSYLVLVSIQLWYVIRNWDRLNV
ncbi:hypothetical protein DVH26_30175 [Paenibacillus sp. H1-7]|nr:hypothetical protein DVH26_30175 [Paenibacillus sp. H1-7]